MSGEKRSGARRRRGTGKLTSVNQSRDTGMALVLICLLFLLANRSAFLLGTAIFLLVLTMTRPQLFTPAARLWFGLAHLLGTMASFVLLTLIFYLVVTPVAIFRRLAGADALQLRQWRRTTSSVFIQKEHVYAAADLEQPY